jgi:hypothetical protein
MHRHQLGAIGEGGLDLHLVDQLSNAVHNIGACKNGGTVTHDLGHAFAITGRFHDLGGDDGHGFGVIELETASLAFARQFIRYLLDQYNLRGTRAARWYNCCLASCQNCSSPAVIAGWLVLKARTVSPWAGKVLTPHKIVSGFVN